jgi:hypothetical protein
MVKQNESVNFEKYPDISESLGVDGKALTTRPPEGASDVYVVSKNKSVGKSVIPEAANVIHKKEKSREARRKRYLKQREIGFHLFEFPSC